MPFVMIDFAAKIWSSELSAPPVRVTLPLVVHLAADMCTFEWLDRTRNLLTIAQMYCGSKREVSSNWARWTTMLGRGGGLVLFSSEGVLGVVGEVVEFEIGFEGRSGGGDVVGFCNLKRLFCNVWMSSFMPFISSERELGFGLGRVGWRCGSFEVRLE